MLSFVLYDLSENKIDVENVISFELSRDVSAACDGLRLTLALELSLDEINRVEAYEGKNKIFNGYCDTQRESATDSGLECFIYARSSACILVDNEAKPFTYINPSAEFLFVKNAKPFGFENKLPSFYLEDNYQVSKGTSLYAAINDFVYGISGKQIAVNVNDEIVLPDENCQINLNDYTVLNEKRIINRGSALTTIDYKISSDCDYVYHYKSQYFEGRGIKHSKKLNLLSLPSWQRNSVLQSTLKANSVDYNKIILNLDGCNDISLYTNVKYKSDYLGEVDNYYVSSVCMLSNSKGSKTQLTLNKSMELGVIKYVAE